RGSCAWPPATALPAGRGSACGRWRWRPWRTDIRRRCSRCPAKRRRPPSRARTADRAASRAGPAWDAWRRARATDARAHRSASGALGRGLDGVVEDAQIEIEPRRLVARLDQHVPQREGILAAGDGDQDLLLAAEHPVLADRLRDLLAKELLEVRRAEGGVVPRQLED